MNSSINVLISTSHRDQISLAFGIASPQSEACISSVVELASVIIVSLCLGCARFLGHMNSSISVLINASHLDFRFHTKSHQPNHFSNFFEKYKKTKSCMQRYLLDSTYLFINQQNCILHYQKQMVGHFQFLYQSKSKTPHAILQHARMNYQTAQNMTKL